MENQPLPPPLQGCLVCHTEGAIKRSQGRQMFGLGAEQTLLTCDHCGSVAAFDWLENQGEQDETSSVDEWRIRYRKIPQNYAYAALRFGKAGWLEAEDALEISTQIFVHNERLQQVEKGDLNWLKPNRLTPPPPLMSADEIVYLALKPVNYCKAGTTRLLNLSAENNLLDTGTFYLTNSKIHLLGQRRDRSHKLSEIQKVEHRGREWHIYVGSEDALHYYQGMHQQDILDGELVAAIVEVLRRQSGD